MHLLIIALLALTLGANAQFSSQKPNMRLIAFNETHRVWMTQEQVHKMAEQNNPVVHFMDITEYQTVEKHLSLLPIPQQPAHEDVVRPLLEYIDTEQITRIINQLSQFPTRRYNQAVGEQAADFLVSEYRRHSEHRGDVTVSKFPNTFIQSSVIARIEGDGSSDDIVIIGGHIDSTSSGSTAPGADDDASGSSTVLEVFRVLSTQNFQPKRTIEFHGYAGEEAGLLGSQAIARQYAANGVEVFGMIQFDMTGYVRPATNPTVGIVTDFTDPQLTAFLRTLVDTYTELPWANTACGYGCSDHASWYRSGYRSSFPFEGIFSNSNPRIHTTTDLLQYLSPAHMHQFTRLGLAFVVELSLADE